MIEEKTITVITDDGARHTLHYYIKGTNYNREFERVMYNVGITFDEVTSEIENFSSDRIEASMLLNILYQNFITPNYLLLVSEHFIALQ